MPAIADNDNAVVASQVRVVSKCEVHGLRLVLADGTIVSLTFETKNKQDNFFNLLKAAMGA